MQCSCAVLLDVSYDPLSGKDGVHGAKKFTAEAGYGIELADSGLLTVKHSGRSATWTPSRVDYVLPLVVAEPVVVPEPVKVIEAPKPAPAAQQSQRPQQQFQGKRR